MKTIKMVVCAVLEYIFLAFQHKDFTQNPMASAQHMNTLNYQQKRSASNVWLNQ